jgi:hypothetical protein
MSLGRSRVCLEMADACWGSRDVFAVVEVAESQELNKLVMDTIQRLERVAGTSTHIASIRSFSGASPHTKLVRQVLG